MDYAKESLKLHEQWKGKIEVVATVPVSTKDDLSLAYTPGVAQPCLEIQKDINKSYELTRRHNLCAVITDGTAVLGLGDDAGHRAGLVLHALDAGVAAEPLGAEVLGGVAAVGLELGQAADALELRLADGLLVDGAHGLHGRSPHLVARDLERVG